MKILALLFLLTISVTLSAQNSGPSKYIPLGVCQKPENSQQVSSFGFDYIECGVDNFLVPAQPEEIFLGKLQEIRKNKLDPYACNNFIPGTIKCTGPDVSSVKLLEHINTALRRAKVAGVKVIVFGSGGSRKIPDGFDRQKAHDQFVDLLKQIAPIAKQNDVVIAIEPLRSQECNFINTVKEATGIARLVNHKNIRVLADFYHMNSEKESAESIVEAGNLLVHCHVAETDKRAAPGTTNETFAPFFKALQQIKYKGKISIECNWTNFEKEAPEGIKALRKQQDELNKS